MPPHAGWGMGPLRTFIMTMLGTDNTGIPYSLPQGQEKTFSLEIPYFWSLNISGLISNLKLSLFF